MSQDLQRAQLDAIAQFDAICRSLGVAAWLCGGWAMDFCLGRITRPHEDVDWYVRDGHATDIVAALTQDAWALSNRLPIERQADLVRHGAELSVHSGDTSSPPIEFDVHDDSLWLRGNGNPYNKKLGSAATNSRYSLVYHVVFSTDAVHSLLEVWINGTSVLAGYHPACATMYGGDSYWKGATIYCDPSILPSPSTRTLTA